MTLQLGRYGRYYRCVTHPTCKGTLSANPDGSPKKEPEIERPTRYEIIAADTDRYQFTT
jgi:ssDNA-binding Zn-finger/Zn-ribbon topoisomerase 1